MIQGLTAICFIVLFALCSDTCLPVVADSINMFFTKVLPSVFPFYVAAGLLMSSDLFIKASRKLTPVTKKLFGLSGSCSIAIFIGLVSGYPAGAKITADLYKRNIITRKEAYTLSAFTNNCGPLFLIGTVGTGMLGNSILGIYLWIVHVISALLTGMIFRCKDDNRTQLSSESFQCLSPRKSLSAILTDSMMSMIPIAAAIIFFSALTGILDALNIIPQCLSPLNGIIEITTGIQRTVLSGCLSPLKQLTIISAISSWAGISVHIQVAGILTNAGLSCKKYILGKIVQTFTATIITLSFFCFHPVL